MSDSRQDRGDRRQEPAFCNETFYFQLLDYWIIRLQKIILANCKDTDYYKADESILVETVSTYWEVRGLVREDCWDQQLQQRFGISSDL